MKMASGLSNEVIMGVCCYIIYGELGEFVKVLYD